MSNQPASTLILIASLIAFFVVGGIRPVPAFQDDPFGDPFGGAANPQQNPPGAAQQAQDDPFGAAGNDNPFGGPAATAPTPQPGGTVKLPESVDKVVLAIRETNPSTPEDFMQALRIMFDTRNFDEARSYLGKLKSANVSDSVAFQLVEQIGSDFVYRLIRSEEMSPEGAVFGRNLLESASRHLKSDAQLQTYFSEAASSSIPKRERAARGFSRAGSAGLEYLIQNVTNMTPENRESYEITAALIGSSIRDPLEAVVESGSAAQQAFAISVLGRGNLQKSIPFLLEPLFAAQSAEQVREAAQRAFQRMLGGVPRVAEAKRFLNRQLDELIQGGRPFDVDAFGNTTLWNWTPEGKLVSQKVSPEIARVLRMERLGRALYQIDPADPQSQKVFLACQLTALGRLGDRSISDVVASESLSAVSPRQWLDVMKYCVDQKLFPGAAAAAEIIGTVADESVLYSSDFSPLVRAMETGDRGLRFACTEAIIKLDPRRAFAGASRFIDSVVYFAGTSGNARAVVAHPKFSEGQNLVGTLAQRGYDAAAVTTGRDLVRRASQDSDVEFLLISDAIDRPPLGELIVQLRSFPALAKVPIGILSQKINQERNERIASTDPNVLVMKQPYRVSFRVEQVLPADNREINNAIITWSVLSDILEQALEQKNRTVAIQMLETMRFAYNDDLSRLAVDNSAIVEAMRYPEEAIRQRASRLFLRVTGEKPAYEKPVEQPTASGRVLIVHPAAGEILPLQETLQEVGYTVAVVPAVDQALTVLPRIPSLRFVIASRELGGLAADELNQALAEKFRLNPTPLALVSRSDSYREAPVAKPVFDTQLEQLLKLSDEVDVSTSQRVDQAKVCLEFLQKILSDRATYGFTDPLRHERKIVGALQNPVLTQEALGVLSELATPDAQQALVNFASENYRPVAERQAAVQAFAKAIEKRGILLTKGAILEQYTRYNRSKTLDRETQQVLGSILDVIEAQAGG